jgi:hypothetical protein
MPGVFLASPTGVPLPEDFVPWTSNNHTWTGWDDSLWDICSGQLASGVCLLSGVRGLTMPTVQRWTSQSPAVHGSRWRGMTVLERDVFWPLEVYGVGGSQAWIEHERAFWKTMRPDKTGVWTVTQPDGNARSLICRFADDGQASFDIAPELTGWATYGITLVAESPFWRGDPIIRTFGADDSQNYFGGTGGGGFGPPYYITSGLTMAGAAVDNPGDMDAWPTWTINGPSTLATVGVGTSAITVPIALSGGQWVRIETSPDAGANAQRAIDQAGVDRTSQLGAVEFASIPPGAPADLNASMTGAGTIDVEITPQYLRAY